MGTVKGPSPRSSGALSYACVSRAVAYLVHFWAARALSCPPRYKSRSGQSSPTHRLDLRNLSAVPDTLLPSVPRSVDLQTMTSRRARAKLCRNFALGYCPQGENCKYLHTTNIPIEQTFTMASTAIPTMNAPSELNPNFSFPPRAATMNFSWPLLSPPMQAPDATGFNWTYPQFSPTLSTSTTSSHPTQFRPLSWRTTLCRHFARNRGWCPLGDECGFIHDLSLAAHAFNDIRFPGGNRNPDSGRAGTKQSHCWAYVQGLCRVRDCPYLHPVAIGLFIPHTPCLAWPNCMRGPLCRYKHPEPLIPKVNSLPGMHQIALQMQPQPPSPVKVIPSGTVQYHGTTFFPVASQPPAPAPPQTMPSPQYSWSQSPIGRSVASGQSPYSPESLPFHSPYYEAVSTLPANTSSVPRAFAGPNLDEIHRLAGMPRSTLPPIPEPPTPEPVIPEAEKLEPRTQAPLEDIDEFPYRAPPPGQRKGHARRVSVTLKSKEDSDAWGLPAPRTGRRESWMVHRQRDDPAHRSWPWAPDAFTAASIAGSQSLQLML